MQLQVVYMPKVYILQAARYDTWLLVLLLPKGVVSSFLFLHFARRIMKQAGMTVVQSKLLTARGNGHCGIQQLITRMQTLAAGVGGSNLAWCKPAECELWSAEQPTWRQESQLAQRTLSALQAAPSSVNRCMYRQTFD